MLAMKRAVESLGTTPDLVLVDGNKKPDLNIEAQTVIKGDAKSQSIAAASILAKVSRDRYMLQMAEKYPQYQFEKHKGYGTKLHYQMIDRFGESPIHRPSFLKSIMQIKSKRDIGYAGETAVCKFLRKNGYEILKKKLYGPWRRD